MAAYVPGACKDVRNPLREHLVDNAIRCNIPGDNSPNRPPAKPPYATRQSIRRTEWVGGADPSGTSPPGSRVPHRASLPSPDRHDLVAQGIRFSRLSTSREQATRTPLR